MRKKLLIRSSVFLLICALICSTAFADVGSVFKDVPADAEYAEAVEYLASQGIVKGDNKGNFNPDSTITRAEAATIMCQMMGVAQDAEKIKQSKFSDVPSSHWAVGYIAKAAELGIVSGYGDGRFGLSDPVTYAQMVTMLVSAWGFGEAAIQRGGYPDGYINTAEQCGIASGTPNIHNEKAPRSTVAMLAYNTLQISPYVEQ